MNFSYRCIFIAHLLPWASAEDPLVKKNPLQIFITPVTRHNNRESGRLSYWATRDGERPAQTGNSAHCWAPGSFLSLSFLLYGTQPSSSQFLILGKWWGDPVASSTLQLFIYIGNTIPYIDLSHHCKLNQYAWLSPPPYLHSFSWLAFHCWS
jgi:hypothetical protein